MESREMYHLEKVCQKLGKLVTQNGAGASDSVQHNKQASKQPNKQTNSVLVQNV
jgi:hypothetical protein